MQINELPVQRNKISSKLQFYDSDDEALQEAKSLHQTLTKDEMKDTDFDVGDVDLKSLD